MVVFYFILYVDVNHWLPQTWHAFFKCFFFWSVCLMNFIFLKLKTVSVHTTLTTGFSAAVNRWQLLGFNFYLQCWKWYSFFIWCLSCQMLFIDVVRLLYNQIAFKKKTKWAKCLCKKIFLNRVVGSRCRCWKGATWMLVHADPSSLWTTFTLPHLIPKVLHCL